MDRLKWRPARLPCDAHATSRLLGLSAHVFVRAPWTPHGGAITRST
jgi:hypothetical protein